MRVTTNNPDDPSRRLVVGNYADAGNDSLDPLLPIFGCDREDIISNY